VGPESISGCPQQDLVPELIDRYRGCLLGLAAGDAVGTTLEFAVPGSFTEIDDLVGGGPFELEPGEWTDDTAMALCLASSLLDCGGFDARDQMDRYCRWRADGYMSSNGRCFDIGMTVSQALARYVADGNPFAGSQHPRAAGNGSIMRLAPIVLFYFPSRTDIQRFARLSSETTHAAEECLDACAILAEAIRQALAGLPKDRLLARPSLESASPGLRAIADGSWRTKPRAKVRGTGYVVESLEAALWCFAVTDTFADCILAAANLGHDADTTAAVAGQIAGAYYGVRSIPSSWLAQLARCDEIEAMARALYACRESAAPTSP
jgi:ADP-ribosyl-[dinitrogen reductase] hydrolase